MHVVWGGILYVVCSGPPALPGSSRKTSLLPSALRMSLLGYGTRAHATQLRFWLRKVSSIGVSKAVLSFVGISQNRTVRFGASASSPVNGGAEFLFQQAFPEPLQWARSSVGIKMNQVLRKFAEITDILPISKMLSGCKWEGPSQP